MIKYNNLNFSGPEPSDLFIDSIPNGFGTSELTCEFCGKTHLAMLALSDSDNDINGSWVDYCESRLKEDPEGVELDHNNQSISGKDIDGKTYVVGCSCNTIHRYEKWIWENRATIRYYLKERCAQEKIWADQEHLLNVLAGIDK